MAACTRTFQATLIDGQRDPHVSRKSPERAAWRKQAVEAARRKAAEETQPTPQPARNWQARSGQQRFLIAMVAATAIWYLVLRLLETLATRLGVVLVIQFDNPVTYTRLIGRSWQTMTYTSDHTVSWMLLGILSVVIAFWLGRAVFHGDIRAAFNQRWLWLMAGWVIIIALMIVELRLIQPVVAAIIRWTPRFGLDLSGFVLLVALCATANLSGWIWTTLMRICRVPARDVFSDPDF